MGAMVAWTMMYCALVYLLVSVDFLKPVLVVLVIIFGIWYPVGMVKLYQRREYKNEKKRIQEALESYAPDDKEEEK